MENLKQLISDCFEAEPPPNANDLVINNGFDELEKESACAFFTGKSWVAVLKHLQGRGFFYLEEWTVLNIHSLNYYLRAYLEFLAESLIKNDFNIEFVTSFFHALYQVIYIHKGSPFSTQQTHLLKKVALVIIDNVIAKELLKDEPSNWDLDWLLDNIELFLATLESQN